MSARPQPGDRPQPVYATREAIDQGAALLRGRYLETAVEEAVRTGRVLYNGSPRGVVFDPAAVPGWVARFRIVPARHREGTQAAEAERAREAGMPVRVFRGKGGCYLPGFLYSWLHNVEAESFSVVDLAVLATVALGLENGKSPFAKSEFAAGGIVIDSALGFTFLPHLNPGGDIGERRARDSIVYLNANDLLAIDTASDAGQRSRSAVACGSF